jgi:hemoglobin
MSEEPTVYERAGGMPFFEALTTGFYERVAADPALLAVYPDPENLEPARRHLALFLAQYWGGPTDYDRERGHPRLRMRHAPFAIGMAERDLWYVHMRKALLELEPPQDVRKELLSYFRVAAEAMRNRP